MQEQRKNIMANEVIDECRRLANNYRLLAEQFEKYAEQAPELLLHLEEPNMLRMVGTVRGERQETTRKLAAIQGLVESGRLLLEKKRARRGH